MEARWQHLTARSQVDAIIVMSSRIRLTAKISSYPTDIYGDSKQKTVPICAKYTGREEEYYLAYTTGEIKGI